MPPNVIGGSARSVIVASVRSGSYVIAVVIVIAVDRVDGARRVSPPPSPKTYDEALRPPAVARVVDDHEDASTVASTLSDDASETTEEDPYHVASPSQRRRASALPENGVLPPALLPSVLRDGGEVAPRAPAAPLM